MKKRLIKPTAFPTVLAYKLAKRPQAQGWLIQDLWRHEAVGIVGGEPKCCKSYLGLELAVSVAGGVPCLGRFMPLKTGRVLVFAAEDQLHEVRARLSGIALRRGIKLQDLPIHVITVPAMRIDQEFDCSRLAYTIRGLKPVLTLLDPFVRLHRISENDSSQVALPLGFLREMQRRYHTAIVLVHHFGKGTGSKRGGQALRGSSEFHAWGDSNLYLRRFDNELTLSVEQRYAASIDDLMLHFAVDDDRIGLEIVPEPEHETPVEEPTSPAPLREMIVTYLKGTDVVVSQVALRAHCRVRKETLLEELEKLVEENVLERVFGGYVLAEATAEEPQTTSGVNSSVEASVCEKPPDVPADVPAVPSTSAGTPIGNIVDDVGKP